MKRNKVYFEESTESRALNHQSKKQKVIHLSETQKRIADKTIPYLLDHGRTDLIETQFKLTFNVPKKVETLLAYTNYQMFWWTIEHQDFELMQYVLNQTTERGKFLIICHNNYEIIKKFIDLNIEKIKDGTYQSLSTIKTFKILLDANPDKSDLIMEIVKKSINENDLNNLEYASLLKADFKTVFANFTETESTDYKANEEVYYVSTSDNSDIEQELVGKLPHSIDYL